MKKNKFTIIIALVFLIGLSVLLYPTVADYFNSFSESRVVAQYYQDLTTLKDEDFTALFDAARAYNEKLPGKANRFVLSDAELAEYQGLLNPFGNGVMGTLIISKIKVKLPIYHGTDAGVLQKGAGHFEGTSLPIGGLGTHSVITGHRGLPSSTLLTRLDRMAIGDTFVLNILNEVLTYRVDQIVVVLPDELDELAIDPDKDYCTLITCTPYGINSHRLLVRGVRIPNEEADVVADAEIVDSNYVAAFIMVPVFIIVVVYMVIRLRKIYGKNGGQ